MPQSQGNWTEKILHTFSLNGKDWTNPEAGLIFGASGSLFGTTSSGGDSSCFKGNGSGTVFEITP